MSERRFSVSDFANNADRFDAYEAECDRLEQQLAAEREARVKAEEDLRNAITAQNELHEQIAMYQQRNREAMKQEPVAVIVVNASGQIRLEDMSGRAFDISGFAGGEKLYAAPIPPADVSDEIVRWKEAAADLGRCFDSANKRIAELERELAQQKENFKDLRSVLESTQRENVELTRKLAAFEATRQRVIAGALYDLFGWLTTRRTAITLSDKHDAGIAADTLVDFAKMRGLSLDDPLIESWQVVRDGKEELTKLLDEARKWEREECLMLVPSKRFASAQDTKKTRVAKVGWNAACDEILNAIRAKGD